MSLALVEAARETGIRLTLLPVLYMAGGFDGRALSERQRRFGHDLPAYRRLVEALLPHEDPTLRIGLAMHSLRAVPEPALRELLADRPGGAGRPLHIHIAEQVLEVEECLAARGARPVEWLLDHADVDADWTLVHATHLSPGEVAALAATPAVVAICTTTEANLGDGLFPLGDFLAAGGRFGVGSDSNVSVSPVEELRWLEYGQRLALRARYIGASASQPSVGTRLLEAAVAGGRQSVGQPGQAGDGILLDGDSAWLAGVQAGDLHDRFVFAGNQPLVREVRVAGRVVVGEGRHPRREAIATRFRAAMGELLAD
jgi:formimidoylglutamate deiminase